MHTDLLRPDRRVRPRHQHHPSSCSGRWRRHCRRHMYMSGARAVRDCRAPQSGRRLKRAIVARLATRRESGVAYCRKDLEIVVATLLRTKSLPVTLTPGTFATLRW